MGGIDHHDNPHLGTAALVHSSLRGSEQTMTDEQLAAMHRLLANYHRKLATEAMLDVVQQYHADLAQRLADEAGLIPRRTAILERLHEREQQKTPGRAHKIPEPAADLPDNEETDDVPLFLRTSRKPSGG
jgi:hypothetical protein